MSSTPCLRADFFLLLVGLASTTVFSPGVSVLGLGDGGSGVHRGSGQLQGLADLQRAALVPGRSSARHLVGQNAQFLSQGPSAQPARWQPVLLSYGSCSLSSTFTMEWRKPAQCQHDLGSHLVSSPFLVWALRHVHFLLFFFLILFIYFLYSRFLLVIYFIPISVYMSIPIPQFITPPPPAPLLSPLGVHTFVLYICVSISALQTGPSVPFF